MKLVSLSYLWLIICALIHYVCINSFNVRRIPGRTCLSKLKVVDKPSIPYPGYGKKKSNRNSNQKQKNSEDDLPENKFEPFSDDHDVKPMINPNDVVRLSTEERLNKVLARAGIASRRKAEAYILDGRVTVNSKIVNELSHRVDARKDVITVDGKKVTIPTLKQIHWVAINKPKNVLATMNDEKDRETICSLVPRANDLRLVPVGRLERDATGLMLMTNEVGYIHPLTHRSYRHRRRYEIVVEGVPSEEVLTVLRDGKAYIPSVVDAQGNTAGRIQLETVSIKIVDSQGVNGLTLLDVQMEEVVSNQLQKICEFVMKTPLYSIKRLEFGPIKLGNLKRGQWRELSNSDVERLKKSIDLREERPEREREEEAVEKKRNFKYQKKVFSGPRARNNGDNKPGKYRKPGSGYASRTVKVKPSYSSSGSKRP